VLIDSCAWIDFFYGTEKGSKVKEILKNNACFTSAICIAELSEWIEREKLDRAKITNEINSFSTVIDMDRETLELAGILKFEKRKTIKDFGLVDAIILATAKKYNLKVLTSDKHFEGENAIIL
jgi:predicted nucleic acid-binding protein